MADGGPLTIHYSCNDLPAQPDESRGPAVQPVQLPTQPVVPPVQPVVPPVQLIIHLVPPIQPTIPRVSPLPLLSWFTSSLNSSSKTDEDVEAHLLKK